MEQVYWLSPPTERGTDTRLLLYRYGNFAYAGSVLTEPVRGLEYLPGVLTGIQAVQGQVPYLCECSALPPDSPYTASLLALQRALDLVHSELDAHTERLAALAAAPGNEWIDAEGGALYFEFETVPGYTCNNSEVIFAKSYRGELMLTLIWYAPHGCLYVTLSPSSGEEQTLVDTLFPQIYGKRRGVTLYEYKSAPARYDERLDRAYIKACRRTVGARPGGGAGAGGGGDGKEPEEEEEEEGAGEEGEGPLPPAAHRADPSRIFQRISVWEGSGEVPDPDVIKARDLEEGAAAGEGKEGEEEEGEGKEAEGGGGGGGGTVDVSGGEGYTQVYLVMSPSPTATRTPVPLGEDGALGGGGGGGGGGAPTTFLVPREVLFRFGNWVYGGEVDFPVEQLRLGDVPYVLPALQKQQGRLDYIADAKALPAGYTLTPTLQQFMAATAILKAEMEDSQTELAQLGSQPANAWIDEEGAASFFELSFRASSIAGAPASAAAPGAGLAGAEVIAAKIYLFGSSGVVLHVVWFRGSLYCVLADNTDDLPLLDVAFPDVTARNRVVQVREYKQSTAEKLADGSPGAPLPKALRVWEGRRKGAFAPAAAAAAAGGGGGAGAAAAGAGAAAAAAAAAVADTKPAAAAQAAAAAAPAAAAAAAAAESKEQDAPPAAVAPVGPVLTSSLDIEGDLYDMGGVTAGAKPAARPAAAAGASAAAASAPSSSAAAAAAAPAAAKQPAASQIIQGVAKAPHFVAPLSAGAGGGSAGASSEGPSIMGMASKLIMVGGKEDESAPWDATGKPRAK